VQAKITPARPLADRFHRWAIRHGFPLLLWLAPRLPRRLLLLGARVVIFLVFAVYRAPLADIERNLGRILGPTTPPQAIRSARREMVRNLAFYWADLFRFAQLPPERAVAELAAVSGFERIDEALARGHGAILCTAHLGNWELGGVLLGKRAHQLSVVYVPDRYADVESFRSRLRAGSGVEEIPLKPEDRLGALPALRALRANRLLAMQGDRDFNDRGIPFDFFGAPVRFPPGPFLLAQMTGAPLLPTFIVYTEDHRFAIEVAPPIVVPPPVGRTASETDPGLQAALGAWVAELERAVRRWPTQWYSFYDFWRAHAPAPDRD
jgi:lauroyl/myristoyl acyltransferase